ncbi:MAG: alpha/beta fold hydrolase [Nitrospinae bacterium]|nr:alpha/beta fold hydrolase [Nitrospinota bacterium]
MDIQNDTFGGEYPFRPNYTKVYGHRMHYVDEAPAGKPNAEPIVLLHGNPTWSFLYRKFIPPLVDAGFRAIAPDYVGWGRSDKPFDRALYRLENRIQYFTRFMDTLDLHDITLVMQDWGGPIGLGYAVEHPERIKRLVIMSTWAFEWPEGVVLPSFFQLCREPYLGDALLMGYNLFIEGFLFTEIKRKERLTPEMMRGFRAPFPDYLSRVATTVIQDVPLTREDVSFGTIKKIEERLDRLKVPTLLVWGEEDLLLPAYDIWKKIYPQSELHMVPRAGHFIQEDAPEEVVGIIKGFLSRNP